MPFSLKSFSCSSGTMLLRVSRQVWFLLLITFSLCVTSCHATPRMAAVRYLRMGACAQGAEASIRAVANCSPSKFRGPLVLRAVKAHRQQRTPRVQAEPPHARGRCVRVSGRGQEVGSSNSRHLQRVVRAQDVIDQATAQNKLHEEEVVRLAQFQAEASKPVRSMH